MSISDTISIYTFEIVDAAEAAWNSAENEPVQADTLQQIVRRHPASEKPAWA